MSSKSVLMASFAAVLCFAAAGIAQGDPNLVGWWNFDDGSGSTAADSSGLGNNGSLVNGPQWITGRNGGGLRFDGSSSYELGIVFGQAPRGGQYKVPHRTVVILYRTVETVEAIKTLPFSYAEYGCIDYWFLRGVFDLMAQKADKRTLLNGVVVGIWIGVIVVGAALFIILRMDNAASAQEAASLHDGSQPAAGSSIPLTETQPPAPSATPLSLSVTPISQTATMALIPSRTPTPDVPLEPVLLTSLTPTSDAIWEGPITIGLTAGASTPDRLVGAVVERVLALR